ncbi:hypothetical protein G6K88_15675 [Agrobacterium rhizogenes]|jgi:hypothetical protein|uniref:hypothetical protein n=1 Tax=Rhizobium rhizogenes TaxID=359 RepID=UPI000DE104B1|nr:hypothetical protein [Rhizobium rhizogenes]NTI03463.1 hypothetical protein [Rhizobium rhizogenes]NTI10268.1 hypothetical protein [Rhizobium rhizogenes]
MHEKAQGNTADTTSKPSALTNSLLDRRTHEWRRRAELMLMFADALGGPSKIDDMTASKIASAADMRVIAEIARARFLRGEDISLDDVVRAERAAGLTEKALQIGVRHGKRRRSPDDVFAGRSAA